MIAQLAVGFVVFALVLALFALYSEYLRKKDKEKEGFEAVPQSAFVAQVTPGGADETSALSPGGAMDPATEKLIESAALPAMSATEAERNWGVLTSERCYRADVGESLKKTRNFLQRTNNYQRMHPDSCSAPNHEMIGTFYSPMEGVGRYPASGANYPPSVYPCA